uniref:L-dopachrome isomerase n=1 Tax=Modiolus philippinarum TaxID=310899 RepID=A0A3R5SW46_9BIVA|nr:macrophage migration inhibitory factor-like protein [Modiolus philippinarum]
MPTFAVYTNLPKGKIPDDFLQATTDYIAERLNKPKSYVCVRVHPEQIMSFGGTTEPCASVDLYSIGSFEDKDKNNDHAEKIGEYIRKKLEIPIDRFYITFFNLERHMCGYNGKTFAK